nr:hypothetical protein [Tanacetum cinerariifolium]
MPEDLYAYVVVVFQALPPPDYVPGPEEPEQPPPSPVYIPYVPEPVCCLTTVDSLGYIPESDPDEDPEDDDEDPEEDPADYLADHDDDDDEEEPSRDDADEENEEQDEDDDYKEEEHPASADSIPPPPALRVTARISFRPHPPTMFFTKEDVKRFLAMPIPPPSPPTPLSSLLPQIPSPSLPASPPILSIPLPAASPPLQLLSSNRRADRPERAEDIGYGIRDTWIDPRDVAEEEALTTLEGVNSKVTELAIVQEQDTQDIYGVMEDTQGRQTEIFQSVEALVDNRQYHYEIARLVDQEARFSREAWAHSMGLGLKMAPKKAATKQTTRLNPGATPNPNSAPSTTTITVTNAQLQAMIDQGVNTVLAARDTNRTGDDNHTSGTGVRKTEHITQECTYQDFMKCQPLYFKGTEGVVELTQWFERMETIFCISNCLAENQIKFATCTLLAGEGVELLELGFELDDQEWVEMGSFLFVRLEIRSRGFKASIFILIIVFGTSQDLLGSSLSKVLLQLRVIEEEVGDELK